MFDSIYEYAKNNGINAKLVYYSSLKESRNFDPEANEIYTLISNELGNIVQEHKDNDTYSKIAIQLNDMGAAEYEKEIAVLTQYLGADQVAELGGYNNLLVGNNLFLFIQKINTMMGVGEKYEDMIKRMLSAAERREQTKQTYTTKKGDVKHKWDRIYTNFTKDSKTFIPTFGRILRAHKKEIHRALISKNISNLETVIEKLATEAYKDWIKTSLLRELGKNKDETALFSEDEVKEIMNTVNSNDELFKEFKDIFHIDTIISDITSRLQKANNERLTNNGKNLSLTLIENILQNQKVTADAKSFSIDNIGEWLNALIGQAFADLWTGKREGENISAQYYATGSTQQKSDLTFIIEFASPQIREIIEEIEKNTPYYKDLRQRNLEIARKTTEALRKINEEEKKLKQLQSSIVHVNQKDYFVGGGFSGFSTGAFGGSGGISFLRDLYKQAGKYDENTERMFSTIINLGPSTIGKNMTSLKTTISNIIGSDIAYALFDDVESIGIAAPMGGNQIHILNLNGINIPLSYYFKLLANAFSDLLNNEKALQGLVSVSLNPVGAIYSSKVLKMNKESNEEEHWAMWNAQYEASQRGEIAKIKFLSSFTKEIQKFLPKTI